MRSFLYQMCRPQLDLCIHISSALGVFITLLSFVRVFHGTGREKKPCKRVMCNLKSDLGFVKLYIPREAHNGVRTKRSLPVTKLSIHSLETMTPSPVSKLKEIELIRRL